MVFLVSSWFGCFRFDDNENLDQVILFEKDVDTIAKKLSLMASNKILPEEKQLVKGFLNIIVNQKRLRSIGHYNPFHPFFKTFYYDIEKYEYSSNLLKNASLIHASKYIDEKLSLPDFQIIQKVHAIDDLLHSLNVFDERLTAWNVFSIENENLKSFQDLMSQMSSEINKLQAEIKDQTMVIAPNTSILIGPMLTARLLVHAGSMEKFARLPASSIQLLGAEKALFRFKKEGGKPPKHGVIFQHEALLKASKKDKGKIARLISLKIILAIRADVYTKRDIGMQLKEELEFQIKQLSYGGINQNKHK